MTTLGREGGGVRNSSVARGGAMGRLHPPNQNCLAIDIIDFSKLYIQELNIKIDFK
jgi:hypothetical protein